MSLALNLVHYDAGGWRKWARNIPDAQLAECLHSMRLWLTDAQKPPPGDWRTWLLMAGRGFGKTFAGAHWVHGVAMRGGIDTRIALVGGTIADVRTVMIEGESGVLATAPAARRPVWSPSRGLLTWPNGTTAYVYSGENPEALRGPQHSNAWCDELAKWAYSTETWNNLQLGLRLSDAPQVLVTTTPRPLPLLRLLAGDAAAGDIGVAVARGTTHDNPMLPDAFVGTIDRAYGGTRLGRQELGGELIEDLADALWTRAAIEACRARALPDVVRVVVGVDPPAGSTSGGGDACGIVVVALGRDGHGYVIEDASIAGCEPAIWARAVAAAAARHNADRVVAEGNNGGDMVTAVLRAADAGLPVVRVTATRSKAARAEPVSLLYTRGHVHHIGAFPELEDELCGLVTGGGYEGPGRSPDRADAAVWALTEVMLRGRGQGPSVRVM